MEIKFGSLNSLEAPSVSFRKDESELYPYSPTAINKNLEIEERLDKVLFPNLVTGVSSWPFLTLALKEKEKNIFQITNKLRSELGREGGRNIIGPKTRQSLLPYKSMCSKLQNDQNCKELYSFLKRIKFDGNPSFYTFHNHEKKWREAFKKANGNQAIAFIKAYKDSSKGKQLFDVVTQILQEKHNQYNEQLWYGAFCYTFKRCLFGDFNRNLEDAFSYNEYSKKWSDRLLQILRNTKYPIPNNIRLPKYQQLLKQITDNDSKPPLAYMTKQYRIDERPVLSGFRLRIFYNLYFNPTPTAIKNYLEL